MESESARPVVDRLGAVTQPETSVMAVMLRHVSGPFQ